jgi:hypothetical protein
VCFDRFPPMPHTEAKFQKGKTFSSQIHDK